MGLISSGRSTGRILFRRHLRPMTILRIKTSLDSVHSMGRIQSRHPTSLLRRPTILLRHPMFLPKLPAVVLVRTRLTSHGLAPSMERIQFPHRLQLMEGQIARPTSPNLVLSMGLILSRRPLPNPFRPESRGCKTRTIQPRARPQTRRRSRRRARPRHRSQTTCGRH